MKKPVLAIVFCSLIICTHAQSTHDVLVSGGFDLIKTDFNRFIDKAQLGIEGNYFITRNFSAGTGVEFWTGDVTSFVLGARWYPADHAFVRLRGLIGTNDAAVGAGWAKPIHENWRFEAIGDFYFKETEFAVRAGVSYIIKTK